MRWGLIWRGLGIFRRELRRGGGRIMLMKRFGRMRRGVGKRGGGRGLLLILRKKKKEKKWECERFVGICRIE